MDKVVVDFFDRDVFLFMGGLKVVLYFFLGALVFVYGVLGDDGFG